MRTLLFLCSVLLGIFLSCNPNKDRETFRGLQGDWTDGYEKIFIFKDSLCSYLFPAGEFTKFYVHNDSIICFAKTYQKKRFDKIGFKIEILNEDTLVISYYDTYKKNTDRVKLHRTKNILGPEVGIDSVFLSTMAGMRFFPSMVLRISSDSNFFFAGKFYTEIVGNFKCKLNKEQFSFLEEKFGCINYKKIIEHPDFEGCFGPSTHLKIYVRNKKTNYKKSFDIAPFLGKGNYPEVRIFAEHLMNMYRFLELEPDIQGKQVVK